MGVIPRKTTVHDKGTDWSSSASSSSIKGDRPSAPQEIKKLNDAVYQAYRPDEGPQAEIVFLHGVTQPGQTQAYKETWKTADGSVCWPQEWLPKLFSTTAIYLVSYDSSVWMDSTNGRFDMYNLGESLLTSFLLDGIGQKSHCPIILVGHDVGGLVIKQICLHANRPHKPDSRAGQVQKLLSQVKGIFYYATPHGGLANSDVMDNGTGSTLFMKMKVHDEETSRFNSDFQHLRETLNWKTFGVHPSHGPTQGQNNYSNEASGRQDGDPFVMIGTDSVNITRPHDQTSSSFKILKSFIDGILTESQSAQKIHPSSKPKSHRTRKLPFGKDYQYVPIENTLKELKSCLRGGTKELVVLCGAPGTGKSSLAKYIGLFYQNSREHDSVFVDGCYFVECGQKPDIAQLQVELLADLGVRASRKNKSLRGLLRDRLEPLDALVIVDDVWAHDVAKQFIVPGAKLRYLLTSQVPDSWRGFDKIQVCMMEDIDIKYGRMILASKLEFPGGHLPEGLKLQSIFTEIVDAAGSNPLALATLSMAVNQKRRMQEDEYEAVKKKLDFYLKQDGEGSRPSAFGEKYPASVYASMMYAVNLLQEKSPSELQLLCVIALFEGPYISIGMIELFVEWVLPQSGKEEWVPVDMVYTLIKSLESKTLVHMSDMQHTIHGICVSVHFLRHRFMVSSEKVFIKSIQEKLRMNIAEGGSKAHVLCALYGTTETKSYVDVKSCLPLMSEEDGRECLLQFLPTIRGMEFECRNLAEKIFVEIVTQGRVDRTAVRELLRRASGPETSTFSRTMMLLFMASDSCASKDFYIQAFSVAFESVLLLFRMQGRALEAVKTFKELIGGVTCDREILSKSDIPSFPGDVDEVSVFGALTESIWEELQECSQSSQSAIRNIVVSGETSTSGSRVKLMPGALEGLVGQFCSCGVKKEIQFQSLALFVFVVLTSENPESFLLDIPGAVEGLVRLLHGSPIQPLSSTSSSHKDVASSSSSSNPHEDDRNLKLLIHLLAIRVFGGLDPSQIEPPRAAEILCIWGLTSSPIQRLPFDTDFQYVPLDKTVQDVQNHLRTHRAVVLCGESGTGKSSLAKHLGLLYGKDRKDNSVFLDGCYFVECGPGADADSVRRKLLAELGVHIVATGKTWESMSLDILLRDNLEHLDALVILDDVWFDLRVRQLMVPGRKVKYLVTSQLSDMLTGDDGVHVCKMEDIDVDYGRRILAKSLEFAGGDTPQDLQSMFTQIVEATGFDPLALATEASAVDPERRFSEAEYVKVKESLDFQMQQDGKGSRPSAASEKYPRGDYASVMSVVKLLSKISLSELQLMCVMHLFEGPQISIWLLKLFVRWVLPQDKNEGCTLTKDTVYPLIEQLKGRRLVQMWDMRRPDRDDSFVSVKFLRHRFVVLSREEPIKSILGKLREHIVEGGRKAHLLCALYGTAETKRYLDVKSCLPVGTAQDGRECLNQFLAGLAKFSTDSCAQLAGQMFEEIVDEERLDIATVRKILRTANGDLTSAMSQFFMSLFFASGFSKSQVLHFAAFAAAFESIVKLFKVDKRLEAVRKWKDLLGRITRTSESLVTTLPDDIDVDEKSPFPALSTTGALEGLVRNFYNSDGGREMQFQSLALVGFMALTNKDPRSFVLDLPGGLIGLVRVLHGFPVHRSPQQDGHHLVHLIDLLARRIFEDLDVSGKSLSRIKSCPEHGCRERHFTYVSGRDIIVLAGELGGVGGPHLSSSCFNYEIQPIISLPVLDPPNLLPTLAMRFNH